MVHIMNTVHDEELHSKHLDSYYLARLDLP
jgi:hypothetical protein